MGSFVLIYRDVVSLDEGNLLNSVYEKHASLGVIVLMFYLQVETVFLLDCYFYFLRCLPFCAILCDALIYTETWFTNIAGSNTSSTTTGDTKKQKYARLHVSQKEQR